MRLHCCFGFGLLALLGLGGCALRPAPTTPTTTGRRPIDTWQARRETRWIELVSPHFVLQTDFSPADAERALLLFEGTHRAFAELAFSRQPATPEPIDVVLFASEEEFADLAPRGAAGFFLAAQNGDVSEHSAIAMHAPSVERALRRFQHELCHRFLATRVRGAPPWLEEGLAEYFSTLQLDGEEAILGALPVNALIAIDRRLYGSLMGQQIDERATFDQLPRVSELLVADERSFHDPAREVANYAASWTLVHLFLNGPEPYAARFVALLDDLGRGKSVSEAWRARYGDLAPGELERAHRAYILRGSLRVRKAVHVGAGPPFPQLAPRAMSASEVHLLRARLLPWDRRENIVRAGAELERARSGAPGSPEVSYWSALYHRRWRRYAAAEAELLRAASARPGEARYWHALADVLDEASAEHPGDRGLVLRRDDALAHLLPLARTPATLDLLARQAAARGQRSAALDYARRAVALGPGCWSCRDTLALLGDGQARFLGTGAPVQLGAFPLARSAPPETYQFTLPPEWLYGGVGNGVGRRL